MREAHGMMVLETLGELIDPRWTAIVAVDIQNDFCHPDGHFARHGKDLAAIRQALPAMRRLVTEGRRLGLPVCLVQQGTLPGGVSNSPAWRRFKTRDGKSPFYTLVGSWGWEVDDGLEPAAEDLRIGKFRPDAFVATSLDQLLRARGIQSVVILGTVTEGCVESTVRGASYHDYYVVVARDAVASTSAVLHEGSLRLFEARYPLAATEEILALWRGAGRARLAAGQGGGGR